MALEVARSIGRGFMRFERSRLGFATTVVAVYISATQCLGVASQGSDSIDNLRFGADSQQAWCQSELPHDSIPFGGTYAEQVGVPPGQAPERRHLPAGIKLCETSRAAGKNDHGTSGLIVQFTDKNNKIFSAFLPDTTT